MMEKKRILIIDDHHDILEMLALFLNFLGYESIAVKTGKQALETAASEPPELIILDLALPDMSGLEVATKLKRDPRTSEIPIVILTALVADSWTEAAKQAGVSEVLSKPCPMDELRRVLERLVNNIAKKAQYADIEGPE